MYYVTLVVIIVLCLFTNIHSEYSKKRLLIACFAILTVLASLRGSTVGTDTHTYIAYYNNFISYGYKSFTAIWNLEPGFLLLYTLIHKTVNNIQWFFFIASVFTSISFGRFIYKYSSDVRVSIILYYLFIFPRTMNITRMYIAIAFILFAYDFIITRQKFKAIGAIVLAVCFHYSAIAILPITFLAFLPRIDRKVFSLMAIAGAVIYGAFDTLIAIFNSILPKYAHYLTAKPEYVATLSWKYAALYGLIILLGLWVVIKHGANNKHIILSYDCSNANTDTESITNGERSYYLSFIFFIWSIIFLLLASKVFVMDRFFDYFYYSFLVFMPNTIELAFDQSSKRIASIAFLILFIYAGMNSITAGIAGCYPYVFCF